MKQIILKSDRLILRQLKEQDAHQIAQIANNYNIWINVRDIFPHPYTKDDALFFINLCKKEKIISNFAIILKNEIVGIIGLKLFDDVYKNTAELGFWIGEPYWNKGIATEATKLIIDYGFKTLGLRRIHAGVFDYNLASAKVLEKCGFYKEATFKKAACKNEKICDEHLYAILNNNKNKLL